MLATINNGDTAWLLISAALVLLMTPGLAFFYSGLVPARSAINTINMSFICLGIIPLVWTLAGFSLAFSHGNRFIGSLHWAGLVDYSDMIIRAIRVPSYAFMVFQMMFAVITPALISGTVVGRMHFKAYVLFIAIWSLVIYSPIAHWVWGPEGWLANLGAIDFAGGTVVHINAAFAALMTSIILGPRPVSQRTNEQAHNIPFVMLGASLLWFGWFGFNAGSAVHVGLVASLAFLNTALAPAASIVTWTVLCWIRKSHPTAIGKSCAAVIGLVAITPAAGYVNPVSAILIGCMTTVVCHFAMVYKEHWLRKVDDCLDVFICHGLGGLMGSLLTGVFASHKANPLGPDGLLYGHPEQVLKQAIACLAVILFSSIGTAIILLLLKCIMRIRINPDELNEGIDKLEHGESAYRLT